MSERDGLSARRADVPRQTVANAGPEVAGKPVAPGPAGGRTPGEAAELPSEAVAAGFMIEPVGDRVRLFHHCGNVVRVADPTDPQLR